MTTSPVFENPFAAPSINTVELGRTDTRTNAVHLVDCPHLVGRAWHVAEDAERVAYPLCGWSTDQLQGHGRSHPTTLVDAMRELGTPPAAVALIREYLKFVTFDEIWLPYSRSYVALGLEGRAVASFGKTYVRVGGRRIELPDYVPNSHEGHRTAPAVGELCARHFVDWSLTGHCDQCD